MRQPWLVDQVFLGNVVSHNHLDEVVGEPRVGIELDIRSEDKESLGTQPPDIPRHICREEQLMCLVIKVSIIRYNSSDHWELTLLVCFLFAQSGDRSFGRLVYAYVLLF